MIKSNKHLQKASLRIHNVCLGMEQIWYKIFSVSQHFVFRTRVNFSEVGGCVEVVLPIQPGCGKKLANVGRDGQFNPSREIQFSGMNGNRENSFSALFS